MSPVIAVTGSTGALGGRVAARLADMGVEQRLLVRDPSRAPELPGAKPVQVSDYGETDEMTGALEGADAMLLVSFEETQGRAEMQKAAIDAAVAARVGRIVYTSFLGAAADATFTLARDHFHTEEHLRSSGVAWTAVRDSIYLDFVPFFAGKDGAIRGPAGEGRVAPVARDDIADVATVALTSEGHEGQVYELTGSDALTLAEWAQRLSRGVGREIEFVDETVEEAWESRRPSGEPDWIIEGWVSTYQAIAAGELDKVTDDVERLTGHPPATLEQLLERYPESWAHLTGG
jgi:NAD(P)H dehydrogenase (quinone)